MLLAIVLLKSGGLRQMRPGLLSKGVGLGWELEGLESLGWELEGRRFKTGLWPLLSEKGGNIGTNTGCVAEPPVNSLVFP